MIASLSLFALMSWADNGPEIVENVPPAVTEDETAQMESDHQTVTDHLADPNLRVLSWNFGGLNRKNSEFDRLALVMNDADLVILQDVEFGKSGENALTVIAGLLTRRQGVKVCKAWFKTFDGDRGRHAFLWKQNRVAIVTDRGQIVDECSEAPELLLRERVKSGDLYANTFFFRPLNQLLMVGSIQSDKSHTLKFNAPTSWPAIVFGDQGKSAGKAGDFRTGFKKAGGGRGGTQNFWFRDLQLVGAEVLDLEARFRELSSAELKAGFPGRMPILSEFSFADEKTETLKMKLIKRKTRR